MFFSLVLIGAIALGIQAIIGLGFFATCIAERETRASVYAFVQFALMAAVLVIYLVLARSGFFYQPLGGKVLILLICVGLVGLFLVMRREPNPRAKDGSQGYVVGKVRRFDERDLVFARNRTLRPGTQQYTAYYEMHPEREAHDAQRRQKGGPVGPVGKIDYPDSGFEVAMAAACLSIPHYLSRPRMVTPGVHPMAKQYVKFDSPAGARENTRRIKGFAKKLGADMVGVARINPNWIYSHRGEIFNENWEDWGRPMELEHTHAVVFAEEMDWDLTMTGPHTPTLIESMRNYAKGAFISTQLAAFIANLGHSATANHLRHYELILPAVAVDAGLGELSRMGYLLTKAFGPRIRLSAVTTDMPLVADKPVDLGIQSFCAVCKKCAVCCPSQSIPEADDPKEVNGTLRWKLNEETCFDHWAKVGTDCNVCMRVCPWSHARTWPHRLIVYLTQRNRLNQRLFTLLDDIFYGYKPKAKKYNGDWAGY
ncbi:MAG: reductive dehalogenase [Desulfobacteraceae bacterium]